MSVPLNHESDPWLEHIHPSEDETVHLPNSAPITQLELIKHYSWERRVRGSGGGTKWKRIGRPLFIETPFFIFTLNPWGTPAKAFKILRGIDRMVTSLDY